MTVYSIDPGSKGAISLFRCNDNEINYIDSRLYTNIKDWYDFIINSKEWLIDTIIVIEKVHSMPKQGVVSTFNFGRKLGEVEAMCEILGLKSEYISPRDWKKYFDLINKPKNESCNVALKLESKLSCIGSRGGCLDGIADSYLIGRYYIENFFKG